MEDNMSMDKESIDKEIERVFGEFMQERNFVPYYAKFLAEEHPEFLIKPQ